MLSQVQTKEFNEWTSSVAGTGPVRPCQGKQGKTRSTRIKRWTATGDMLLVFELSALIA